MFKWSIYTLCKNTPPGRAATSPRTTMFSPRTASKVQTVALGSSVSTRTALFSPRTVSLTSLWPSRCFSLVENHFVLVENIFKNHGKVIFKHPIFYTTSNKRLLTITEPFSTQLVLSTCYKPENTSTRHKASNPSTNNYKLTQIST